MAKTSNMLSKCCDYRGYSCNCEGFRKSPNGLCVCGHSKAQHNSVKEYPLAPGQQLTPEERAAFAQQFHNFVSNGHKIRGVMGQPTGEFRSPKKGEWYLSGEIPEVYRANNDLSSPYHICELLAR